MNSLPTLSPVLIRKPCLIEKQKEVVSKTKDKNEATLSEPEKLMNKRDELRWKELMEAFMKSDRTYDEIMESSQVIMRTLH